MTDSRKPLAQGDVIFVPIPSIPSREVSGSVSSESTDAGSAFIVAHSETGHHHVVLERPDVRMFSGMNVFHSFLEIQGDEPVDVRHLRDHHTHETLTLAPGAWKIVRQRTPDVAGQWRLAQD